MRTKYTLYGWHLSYFTGKVLCYLRYKQVPFVLHPVKLYTLTRRIKQKTGAVVMPVVVTPQGQWIQDSSVIIDHIEAQLAQPSIIPATPMQRFCAYLIEAWGDEWWVPVAMNPAEQVQVRDWLSLLGGERLLTLDIPRLQRQGLRVRPEGHR